MLQSLTSAAKSTMPPSSALRGASNLGSLQLELRFDPQALELKGIKAGKLGNIGKAQRPSTEVEIEIARLKGGL